MQAAKQYNILLMGDSCIDEYQYGTCDRISPEAPVPVLNFTKSIKVLGMAGNVYNNLKTLNKNITFLTNTELIQKIRYVEIKSQQQILRVDHETILNEISLPLDLDLYDCIVVSDYNKGFITNKVLTFITENFTKPIFIDSKKSNLQLNNCFIKINETEYKKLNTVNDNIIVTLGGEGAKYKNIVYKTNQVNVFDVAGAGDTFLAALSYFYLCSSDMPLSIKLANKAASIAVQHPGTYTLTEEDCDFLQLYFYEHI